jgi:dual specificity protein kinase YAK1
MSSGGRRVFTEPNVPFGNPFDNEHGDLIVAEGDVIPSPNCQAWRVVDRLGQGQFGQVFRVVEIVRSEHQVPHTFAMKVSRSQYRFRRQAESEAGILRHILQGASDEEKLLFSNYYSSFLHREHYIILMELLSHNLLSHIESRNYKGLPLSSVQTAARQLFQSLALMKRCQIVHGDLKPENIVSSDGSANHFKVIDFGSARRIGEPGAQYIQSRYYRAPEVVLRKPYSCPIDMWSVGCILGEMFTGLPLFGGQSEIQLLDMIIMLVGPIPLGLIQESPRYLDFFLADGTLKSEAQYCREHGTQPAQRYTYLTANNLTDLILQFPRPRLRSPTDRQRIRERRALLLDLLQRTFIYDPLSRITPEEALGHPFLQIDFAGSHDS